MELHGWNAASHHHRIKHVKQPTAGILSFDSLALCLLSPSSYHKLPTQRHQEAEYVQNMFDCICSLMLLKTNQIAFGSLQGHLGRERELPRGKTEEDKRSGQQKNTTQGIQAGSCCHGPYQREMKYHYGGFISLLWLCWLPHPLRVSLRAFFAWRGCSSQGWS